MNRTMMKKYARLIVRSGANVRRGQVVSLNVSIDQGDFAAILIEECYRAGASRVDVEWSFQKQTLLDYQYRSEESLSTVPAWKEERIRLTTEELPCRILILSDDPDGLAGIDQDKMHKASMARYAVMKKYEDLLENMQQWVIAAVPSETWAMKVFPNLSRRAAVEKLWDAILSTVYVSRTGDPLKTWKQRNEDFQKRCALLNAHHFDTIVYKSANGTDFRAGMIPEANWCGGGEKSKQGIFFNPNLPTEEIFTSPMRGKAEGKLVSTKPLSWQGQLIENFWMRFEDGHVVECGAEKGEELLRKMISMDEGASYLGELALVPSSSPINQSGILFYNTLFDENASCHVALGRGFCDVIENFTERSLEECQKLGVNDSMIHVDFMIGADDLSITGYKDGVPTPIFVNGEWAPEFTL